MVWNLFAARRRDHRDRKRPHRLRCEMLENRELLSTIVALTEDGNLLTFDSESPAEVLSTRPITGLQAGDSLVGIDVRPATGDLYGLANNAGVASLYIINANTAVATLQGMLVADPADLTDPYTALSGTNFGIDFNPVPDRLRVVSETDQNLRINPTPVGGVINVTTDTALAFDASDPESAENPNVVDVAYNNNVAGATTTTLFGIEGIDPDLNCQKTLPDNTIIPALCLVRQGGVDVPPGTPSPNTGLLFTQGAFGRDGVKSVGFDIAPSGTMFVAVDTTGPVSRRFLLVSINDTGADTSRGNIADGTIPILDIAVVPSVQFSSTLYAVNENGGTALITVNRTEGTVGTVTVEFTTINGTATAASDYVTTSGTLTFVAGDSTETFMVPIVNDTLGEGDEFINLLLTNPTGVVIGDSQLSLLRVNPSDVTDTTRPTVTSVLLTGPSRGITGAVVQFSEDLAPAAGSNVANFIFAARPRRGRPMAFPITTATYDPVFRRTTLTVAPFMQTNFRQIDITISSAVTDLAGNQLDGRGRGLPSQAVFSFQIFSGQTVTFVDRDGDRATLTIENGGRLDGIRPLRTPANATQQTQFWILDPIALRSTVSGSVARGPRGNGVVVIAEIIGLDKKEFTPLLSNPSFRVNTLTFSSNATGIG